MFDGGSLNANKVFSFLLFSVGIIFILGLLYVLAAIGYFLIPCLFLLCLGVVAALFCLWLMMAIIQLVARILTLRQYSIIIDPCDQSGWTEKELQTMLSRIRIGRRQPNVSSRNDQNHSRID